MQEAAGLPVDIQWPPLLPSEGEVSLESTVGLLPALCPEQICSVTKE